MWRSTDQGWVIKKYPKLLTSHRAPFKSKDYSTTTNMPRVGRPPKLTNQARRALIREATKRQKITLKVLQSSTAEIGVSVHRTTLNRTLHRAGLYGKMSRKKSKYVWCLPKGMWETPQTYGRRYSG